MNYTQSYYIANREKILAKSKAYREKNQERIKELKDYYRESLYNHLFYEAHRDKIREKANKNNKAYYQKKKALGLTHIPKKPKVYEPVNIVVPVNIVNPVIEPVIVKPVKIESTIKPIRIRRYTDGEGINPFI